LAQSRRAAASNFVDQRDRALPLDNASLVAAMNKQVEKFIIRHRPWCEFPDKNGAPSCMNPATHVITLRGKSISYQVAVCDDCSQYVRNEHEQ
jgi:hypothetical protein